MSPDTEPDLDDPDNPEWMEEDFARAVGPEFLGEAELNAFPRTRELVERRRAETGKKPVSVALSPEVVEHFQAAGPGWQTRIDDTLKQAIVKGG